GPSKRDDDLSEHLPAFEPRQSALEVGERNLGVDHRQQAVCHLGEALADIAHRGAERADNAVLLLKKLHQVDGRRWPRRRSASDQPSAALEAKERAVEGLPPTCSNTTSTPFLAVILRTAPSKRSVR